MKRDDSHSSPTPFDLSEWARKFGWTVAGVSPPDLHPETRQRFQDWLEKDNPPGMHYLERRKEERLSPTRYSNSVQSILCFGLNYFKGWAEGEVKVSNYSWGNDYHKELRDKLEETASALQKILGPFFYRVCVDTSPVLEKPFAVQAGMGWQGKNTLLIHRKYGSQIFLGEILTSLPMSTFVPQIQEKDRCGRCTRCIDACPTQALSPYYLHAKKCIAYWNLEHRGEFGEDTPSFHQWIAGCDICQEVCPWNQKLIPLEASLDDLSFKKLSTQEIESEHWLKRIENKALHYVPEEKWKLNLRHLLNEELLKDEDPL